MIMRRVYLSIVGLSLLTVFAAAGQSAATLGDSSDSVETDRKAYSAIHKATISHEGYTVKEIESDSNVVREYISPAGVVFGVAWQGLTFPDLTQLLGSYSNEYHKALRQTPRKRGNRRQQIKTDGLVVEKWGHMRNLRGRAYVPALMPPGVGIDEIR